LVADSRFFYLLAKSVGWSELVSDTIRRDLPGALARRRVLVELVAEADRLTRQQVGRVRADLQYRLQEVGRALSIAIRERYAASTATIETAVDDAARMQGRTEAETAEIYADLRRRGRPSKASFNTWTKPRRPPAAEAGHRSDSLPRVRGRAR
jgi:hypothetical protein